MESKHLHWQYLNERLEQQASHGLLRDLSYRPELIDFASNDYLGFAQRGIKTNQDHQLCGSTGSRLISGNSALAESTELAVAHFHGAQAGLIYSTGYMANTGLLSCLAMRQDTYLYDEYVHASMIDGMRLSHANRLKFRHNDLTDLESKLRKPKGKKWILVESIYSMDGDQAPLLEIVKLAEKYEAAVIVDEAHSTGILGPQGKGLVCELALESRIFARVHTFGKALGTHGAIIIGQEALRQYLINFSRPFIYSTAPPPHFYTSIMDSYQALSKVNRAPLFELIDYFQSCFSNTAIPILRSWSPIQGIIIPDNHKIKQLEIKLIDAGFFARAVRSPTVAVGKERIRICLHTYNTRQEIDQLYLLLKSEIS